MPTEQVERCGAHSLLRLAQQAGRKVEAGVQIDFPITDQDIAEMTGATLHTMSRVLSAWESQGFVAGGRQRIMIREPHKLLLLAEGLPVWPSSDRQAITAVSRMASLALRRPRKQQPP